jgi:hypothetical protein
MDTAARTKIAQTGPRFIGPVGLHKENPKKATATPTTERLLRAFSNITLTIVQLPDRVLRHVTPLTPLQVRILELLGLSPDIYRALAENSA